MPHDRSATVITFCRHCHERLVNRPRGLCWRCYYTPDICSAYPSTSKFAKKGEPPAITEIEARRRELLAECRQQKVAVKSDDEEKDDLNDLENWRPWWVR